MDKAFAQCLSEIEKSYLALPKAARIRIERWIEKLVSTGNNPVWKRDRNEYAKLLLNMVVTRRLDAPFHVLPPDGPLPPFSAQPKATLQGRNLLGPHETSFWRDLYQQFQDVTETKEPGHEFAYREEQADKLGAAMQAKTGKPSNGVAASSEANNLALSREVQSLNMLVKEQSQRIKLLEQQLHDERIQHELQIQRLNYSHRVETNNLKSQLDQFAMEMSVQALSPSRVETRSFLRGIDEAYAPTAAATPASPVTPLSGSSRFSHGRSPYQSLAHLGAKRSPPPAPLTATGRSTGVGKPNALSFLEQKNNITATLNTLDSLDVRAFDITPRPPAAPFHHQPRRAAVSGEHKEDGGTLEVEGADLAEETRFDDSALDASLRWGSGQKSQYRSAAADAEDEAFLAHIDRFQSEIKRVNTNITMTSPDRF